MIAVVSVVVSAKLVDWRRIFQNIFCLPHVRKATVVLLSMFFGKCQPILAGICRGGAGLNSSAAAD